MRNGSYLKNKNTMTTLLSQIIEENMETIICMKMQASENEFVFMSKDGELKYGDKNQCGQNILHAFGGGEKSRTEVISVLEFMIGSEPEY
jgi:hypothetical protein